MRYPDEYNDEYIPFERITFEVQRKPRPWSGDEFDKSYFAMPEKMEACDGMLYCSADDRLKVFGALLENIGIDRAIRFGNAADWRAALDALDASQTS
jgi:hypothetical protein